jgi:hypothetical protein
MKYFPAIFLLLIIGCQSGSNTHPEENKGDTISIDHTKTVPKSDTVYNDPSEISPKVYSNARFRNVTVEKTGDHTFVIRGQGQIFEANFNWVIEDGHDELQKGYTMTDAGAPEWGNFKFTVTAPKPDPNTTLHIILFESSAKDGSRQHELPILLY